MNPNINIQNPITEQSPSPSQSPHAEQGRFTGQGQCADPLVPTIFHEPWWLDIATEGRCEMVEASERGRVVGRLPYFLHRSRLGITRAIMPPLTHFLGPAIAEGEGSINTRFQKRLEITRELIAKLPRGPAFYIKCHRGVTDILAFQRDRFKASVQFTHEIHPRPLHEVWGGLQHKRRSVITRAQKQLSCVEIDPAEFIGFSRQNLKGYRMQSHYDLDICRRLIEASLERRQGRLLATRDAKGNLVTALFCTWDQTSYYYLMNTRRPSAHKGSMSLLAWEAIKDAVQRKLIFDMDGISSGESISFYSGFGASVAPRFIATRQIRLMRLIQKIRHPFKEPNYYC